jgi:hypothetical protein
MRDYMECLGFNAFPCQVVRPRAMEGSDAGGEREREQAKHNLEASSWLAWSDRRAPPAVLEA